MRIPGPPEVLPGRPDAIVDLQTHEGARLVAAQWRYSDTTVEAIDFVEVGADLAPSGPPNRTYDVLPHAEAADFDDSRWRELDPPDMQLRLSTGRICFNWYRTTVTLPERIGDTPVDGATVVFEIVIDDYAEVWVDGRQPKTIGDVGGPVAAGFNAPNRVVLTTDATAGQTFHLAVMGINGPISSSPHNYIWVRSATLELHRAAVTEPADLQVTLVDPDLERVLGPDPVLERVATGFEFTEGPVWDEGGLLFSSPNTNAIYRWVHPGAVTVFRAKSGYTGVDIGRYHQPGSNGLTFDPDGLLTICQHGNRRVIRVNPHGDITVLADGYDGKRLNSPNDLVFRTDGTLYFTDPPFGLPAVYDDPKKELPFSGVFRAKDGAVEVVDNTLAGPNGIAFSPDERYLYVGNWDVDHKVVVRYPVAADGSTGSGEVLFDMTGAVGEDAIDGIKVDTEGTLYVCGPGGIWVLAPDGRHLGTLHLPEDPHNLAWGDADARSLYVTAVTSIYRIRLSVPGIRPDV
jgi:gluconolactonase